MTVTSHHKGHKISARTDSKGVYSIWEYEDGESIKKERPCVRCGKPSTKDGHDHCIRNLPGVEYACCGHGIEDGYAKLYTGKVIKFNTEYKRKQILQLIKNESKK